MTNADESPESSSSHETLAVFDERAHEGSPAWRFLCCLESSRRGLACEWARQTLIKGLPQVEEPNREPLHNWLSVLPTLMDKGDPEQIGREARQIWYAFPRTEMQTAVSKLFEAAGAMLADNPIGYYRCVQAAFINARKASDSFPDIATETYEQIKARSPGQ